MLITKVVLLLIFCIILLLRFYASLFLLPLCPLGCLLIFGVIVRWRLFCLFDLAISVVLFLIIFNIW
jgi:hypothetical protein